MSENKASLSISSKSWLFYSLVITIAVSMAMIAAGGSRGAFGVFFKPMANELGWSSAQMSGTFSLSMMIEGIMSVVCGRLSDRFGTRIVLVFSGLISGTGFVLMSYVNTIWQMYLVYGLAMGIGLGGIVVPIVSMLARWFTSRRTLMTGVALAANGLGQLFSPMIAYQLIANYHWRTSYIVLGVAVFILITLPALFLQRNRPQSIQILQDNSASGPSLLEPDAMSYSLAEARHTRQFWMIIVMLGLYGYCFLSILVHVVPYGIEIGIPASTAAIILAFVGGGVLVGRVVFGVIADRIGNKRTIMVGFILLLASLLWLIPAEKVWALFLFATIGGLGLGAISSSQSPLSAEFFGLKSHGTIYGAIGGGTVILGATGPFVTGYLFDVTGHYRIPFIICAFLSLIGLIINLLLKPKRK